MVSFNRVTLAGNLTRDPELTFTNNGIPVCNTGIAVNRVRSKNEEVDFFDLTIWREAGETIANYKKKGDPILIEGRLQFRQWESNEGERRSKVDVVVDSFQFLSRGSGSEDGGQDGDQRAGTRQARQGAGAGGGDDKSPADFDDGEWEDIPFHHRDYRRRVVADIL